jgi:predicted dehydrogenase
VDPLRIGVLGTARISATALLEPAASVPEVTVAGVASLNRSRAAAYAQEHQIPVAYGSYDALIDDAYRAAGLLPRGV